MSGITWLHLSDWHQKGKDFDRRVVRDALIRDIEDRTKISPDLAEIDFIVFSGDVAFSGKKEEYETVKQELIKPILKACGVRRNRLFIVPGNHDLDRKSFDTFQEGLLDFLNSYDRVKRWLDNENDRARTLEPFKEFTSFVADCSGQKTPDYANIRKITISGKKIAILGINSAWACGRHKDSSGKIDDRGYALIGEPQIYESVNEISSTDLKIAVLHHPLDWLNEDDRNHVKRRLEDGCDFMLQGHRHNPEVNVTRGTSGECIIIPAGACYEYRIAKDPRYTNAYNFVHLDLDSRKGTVFLRRWGENRGEWIEDIESYKEGKYNFVLPKTSKDPTPKPNSPGHEEHPPTPIKSLPLQKPPRVQHFVGREKELDALVRDLQPGHSVSLCGTGGMGKTALAIEAIWKLAPDNDPPELYPDGIIFHSFYHQPQAAIALESIARSYGEDLSPTLVEAAGRALFGRRVLLVLDGTEVADDLEAIISIAGSCGILITSQRRSDSPNQPVDLPPLSLDHAMQLLEAWGGKYAADKEFSRQVCELVGCLPLAIRLAGRYMNQSCQYASEYLTWLKETPLAALDLGNRRSQSIPLLMEHSLSQVGEPAKVTLGIAGALALEPFDPELIAIALEIPQIDANRGLGELVDYGLLLRPDSWYQITHALIHTYAREKLTPMSKSIARLAGYYITFIREQSKVGLQGYSQMDMHRPHILAVQAACRKVADWKSIQILAWEIKDYLFLRGYWAERIAVINSGLIASRAEGDRYHEGHFLNILGTTYAESGNPRKAIEFLEQALIIRREIGDFQGEGATLGNLGVAYSYIGETHRSIRFYEQDLAIVKKIGDRQGEAAVLGNLGRAYNDLNMIYEAIGLHQQALKISREIGDRKGEYADLGNLGNSYILLGEFTEAIKIYDEVLALCRDNGDKGKEGNALGNLGVAYKNLGNIHKANKLYKQQLKIAQEIGDIRGEGKALGNLGVICSELGKFQKAIDFFERALKIYNKVGDRISEGITVFNISLMLWKLEDRKKAVERANCALTIFEQIKSPFAEKVWKQLTEWKKMQPIE